MRLRNLALHLLKLIHVLLGRTPRITPIIFRGIYPVVYTVVYTVWNFMWSRLAPNPVRVDGGLLYLAESSRIGFSVELSLHGFWEKGTTCLFKELISEGQTVVDVGAHVGYFTLLAAAQVGESGKVFAFEPEPSIYSLLVKNIGVNGYKNVIAINKAVSNETGVAKLFVSNFDRGASTIFYDKKDRRTVPIDTVTLDDYFWDRETPIDLVKMDIEGAEMAVLQGMANIIKKNDNLRIITEFIPHVLIRAGVSPTDFLDMIKNYGFRIYSIDEEEECIQPVTAAQALSICDDVRRPNLLLVKGS